MENMTIILFICVAVPMLPVVGLLSDKKSKLFLAYVLVGLMICLVAAEVNGLLLDLCGGDMHYVTTNLAPIAEEILKALPVLYYAWLFSDDRDTLLAISFADGLGFAMLENLIILTQHIETVSIPWAFSRGIGAALMHSACTACVGMGISIIRKRRKLFYCGTCSLLIAAIIFHAIFNLLVQSEYRFFAFLLPVLLYIPQIRLTWERHRKTGKN